MAIEVKIYGRSRAKFQESFPSATFQGYECNIRFCYFTLTDTSIAKIQNICQNDKIQILDIYNV